MLLQNTTVGYRPAIVTEQANAPRSFHAQTDDGAVYRRTSRHRRKPMYYRGSDDITVRSHPSTTPREPPQPQPSSEPTTEEHGGATNADEQDTRDGPPSPSTTPYTHTAHPQHYQHQKHTHTRRTQSRSCLLFPPAYDFVEHGPLRTSGT